MSREHRCPAAAQCDAGGARNRHPCHRGIAAVLATALCLAGCGGTGGKADARGKAGGNTASSSRHDITFRVNGTGPADITWSGATGGTADDVTLPWQRTSRQDANTRDLSITVVLGSKGGDATCSIAIDGQKVTSSLASGIYGRAVCQKSAASGSNPRADA